MSDTCPHSHGRKSRRSGLVPSAADDKLTLLTFVSTSCGTCDALVPALNAVARSYSARIVPLVVAREDAGELTRWAKMNRLKVPTLSAPEAFERYGVDGTPYAFVLDEKDRVAARGGVNHLEHLESLIRQ